MPLADDYRADLLAYRLEEAQRALFHLEIEAMKLRATITSQALELEKIQRRVIELLQQVGEI